MTLTHESLLFSPTRDGVPSSDDNFTAGDLVAAQDALEAEARETLPFSFGQCTYDLGYIKQPLYSCLTCLNYSAVCAACSIACHGEHHLVELFNRRHFRCDCGTERMGAGSCCSISPRDDAPRNAENHYDKNFKNEFCICGRVYDPHAETDEMYQCIVCEDWLHQACVLGVDAPPLGPDDFDQLVCGQCISSNRHGVRKVLERYAGREGTGVMLVGGADGKEVLGRASFEDEDEDDDDEGTVNGSEAAPATSEKRRAESPQPIDGASVDDDQPAHKKLKADGAAGPSSTAADPMPPPAIPPVEAGSTSAPPPPDSSVVSIGGSECKAPAPLGLSEISPLAKLESEGGRVNVYLEEGWMMRWCRCSKCLPAFYDFPYFLEEEEAYEPPDDPDAHKSTLELGMDALSRMPRAQAIEGAMAFQGLSERLKAFLRPHADGGVTITKELIDEFFSREKEARA